MPLQRSIPVRESSHPTKSTVKTSDTPLMTEAKISTASPPSVSTVLKFQTQPRVVPKGTVPMLSLSRFLIPPTGKRGIIDTCPATPQTVQKTDTSVEAPVSSTSSPSSSVESIPEECSSVEGMISPSNEDDHNFYSDMSPLSWTSSSSNNNNNSPIPSQSLPPILSEECSSTEDMPSPSGEDDQDSNLYLDNMTSPSSSPSNNTEEIHVPTSIGEPSPLPFPCFTRYQEQGSLAKHNITRGKVRSLNPPEVDGAGAMVCVNRSQVKGLLEDNIKSLYTQIGSTKSQSSLHKHLRAVCDVGKFIQTSGPIVVTQDAARVYNNTKGSERRRKSGEFYEIVSKHLNILQVYIHGKAFLVHNTGSKIEQLLKTITDSVNKDTVFNERISERLQGLFKTTLEYLDIPRDKQIPKGLLAELTSVKFPTKLQGIQSRHATTHAKRLFKVNLVRYKDINGRHYVK